MISTIYVSKAVGQEGMTAISTFDNFDSLGRAFGFLFNVAASSVISSLFGEKNGIAARQLFVDLIRISLLCSLFVPILFLPLTVPVAKWFGAPDPIIQLGKEYVTPILIGAFIPSLFLLSCGALQAEGRTRFMQLFK